MNTYGNKKRKILLDYNTFQHYAKNMLQYTTQPLSSGGVDYTLTHHHQLYNITIKEGYLFFGKKDYIRKLYLGQLYQFNIAVHQNI